MISRGVEHPQIGEAARLIFDRSIAGTIDMRVHRYTTERA
jgi:hypothetical protein